MFFQKTCDFEGLGEEREHTDTHTHTHTRINGLGSGRRGEEGLGVGGRKGVGEEGEEKAN